MAGQGLVQQLVWTVPLWLGAPVLAQSATVVSIGDGDTLRVRLGGEVRSVRLACIDAPERAQSPWGQQARAQLQALLPLSAAVEVRSTTSDRYGRLVAQLSRGGRNVNQALVASGAAFVYWRYIAGCDRQTYGRLETEARLQRLGVWGASSGLMRPWEYRAGRRRSGSSSSAPAILRTGDTRGTALRSI
jgi:endonuclease YncB( thermonuclease family)